MSDYILIDGDLVIFQPSFGAATVVVMPGTLTGSGDATFNGKALCIDGDEGDVEVQGCMYTTPQYSIPGVGTLKIDSLAGDQVAQKTNTSGTAVLLKGSNFTAKFEVQSPAQQPSASGTVPDSTTSYTGSGSFVTTNIKFKGT